MMMSNIKLILQAQRMYKFKFDPPQQHRRSLQQPKQDHASLATLDKCTQIVREDRLWLRNELKNNNPEVLAFFKQFPRATQLQSLQTKLRKYVQSVKNRIKQEQLYKFRETLHSQNNISTHIPAETRPNPVKRTNQSHSKSHIKSNSSLELSKTTNFRPNRSQERPEPSHQHPHHSQPPQAPRNTGNFRHFQDLLKYKYSQEVIEERQSENVTSARLGRQEGEQNHHPLQEIQYNTSNHYSYGSHNNFFDSKPEHGTVELPEMEKQVPWNFQKKAEKALYQYGSGLESQEEKKDRQIEDIQSGFASRFHKEYEEREQSIFDKHFNESGKSSAHNDPSEGNSVNDFRNVQFGQSITEERKAEGHSQQNFGLRESEFSSTQNVATKIKEESSINEENLFTPQELLLECRNFLKNRENSGKKEVPILKFEQFLKHEPISPSPLPLPEAKVMQKEEECLFTRANYLQASVPQQSPQKEKKEEQSYMFPEIGASEEISLEGTMKKDETFNYPRFQTFANSSNQKISFEKAMSPPHLSQLATPSLPSIPSIPSLPTLPKPTEQTPLMSLSSTFSIQDFIEDLMELTSMSPFINIKTLNDMVILQSQEKAISQILGEYLEENNDSEVGLTTVAQKLDHAFTEQHGKSYPHNDGTINAVYNLLDIDQKGCITREDIDSFLVQIEEAEVENFEEVSEQLTRLFDGADFTNEERLTYWHFYLIKNSEQFERVNQLLSQFEFEIERGVQF